MVKLSKKTKHIIEKDIELFIVAICLLLFACVSFEEEVTEEPEVVLPAPPVNITVEEEEEIEIEEIEEISSCYELTGTERELCLALEQNDSSICTDEECLYQYAIAKLDEDVCEEIETIADKYYCLSVIKGTQQCTLTDNKNGRNKCLAMYANYTYDESLCRLITETTGDYITDCYLAIAVHEMNWTKCNFGTLGESNSKDICRREYAKLTGDTEACEHLWSESWNNDCYRSAAFYHKDPSLCNGIENNYHRWKCYQGVFNMGEPTEIEKCRDISDLEWEGKCISNIAVLQNDSTICNYITTEQEKRNCKLKFE